MTGQHRLIGDNRPDTDTRENPMNFNREPAVLWIGLLAPIVQALAAFLWVSDPATQGIVNAATVAIAGAITGWVVRAENLLPLLTGAAQAVLAVLVAFGLGWSPEQQALVLAPIGLILGFLVRDRVTAPVPASNSAA